MKKVTMALLLLAAFTLPAAAADKTQSNVQIISQGTYVMDSIEYPNKNYVPVPKPSDAGLVIHLEVITQPADSTTRYDLRGWIKEDIHDKHVEYSIPGGVVRDDGIPDKMLWQSHVMGEPNFEWVFYFYKGGRMEIWNMKNNVRYELHEQ